MEEKGWGILGIIVSGLFSGTGILTFIFAKNERKASLREKEANASLAGAVVVEKIQSLYDKMVDDYVKVQESHELKIGQMEQEINMLRLIVKKQNEKCSACPNFVPRRKSNNRKG